MANLKILGAQRVKALTEMLKEQEAAKIVEITREQLSQEMAEEIVDKDLGIHEYTAEIKEIKNRIDELNEILQNKTGKMYQLQERYGYSSSYKNDYNQLVAKVRKGDTEKRIAEVKADFKRKEQRLWLCETLEEAKAIVGIE